ncbi:hypothetical protein RRG08_059794 [Elysia crispata]|uniref:Uncharacterized protein n=1 Tax=Elysia crispata TaxID=231223 RepID=A0AAE1BD73_9GAST|nr:hypothetical protein RRG08_059794 [Elysia crispata]
MSKLPVWIANGVDLDTIHALIDGPAGKGDYINSSDISPVEIVSRKGELPLLVSYMPHANVHGGLELNKAQNSSVAGGQRVPIVLAYTLEEGRAGRMPLNGMSRCYGLCECRKSKKIRELDLKTSVHNSFISSLDI